MKLARRPVLSAVLACAVLLALAVQAQAFTSYTINPSGAIRQTSVGRVSITGGGITVSCRLALDITLRPGPFGNTRPTRIGTVTRASWEGCEGGEIIETELTIPWTVNVENILREGEVTRPEAITGVLVALVNAAIRVVVFFPQCLYTGRIGALFATTRTGVIEEGGRRFYRYRIGELRILEALRLTEPFVGVGCPREVTLRGVFGAPVPAQEIVVS